jgi:disulfide oxidoreductase YuzD
MVNYYDVTDARIAAVHAGILDKIREGGLAYPVTVIDGEPLYDGAVSYPAILRAVDQRLGTRSTS